MLQLTVSGVPGLHGANVPIRAAVESRCAIVPVNAPLQQMVDTSVSVTRRMSSSVHTQPAQVSRYHSTLTAMAAVMRVTIAVLVDCLVSTWSDWSECTVTCGTGIQHSHRHVKSLPLFGGTKCPDEMHMTRECGNDNCTGTSMLHN